MPQDISPLPAETCTSSQIYRLGSLQKSPSWDVLPGARSTVLTQREPWSGGGGGEGKGKETPAS